VVATRRLSPPTRGRSPERAVPRGPRDPARRQGPTTSRKVAGRRRSAAQVPPRLPSPWRGGLASPKRSSTSEHAASESPPAHLTRPKPVQAGHEPKSVSDEPPKGFATARHADWSPKRPAPFPANAVPGRRVSGLDGSQAARRRSGCHPSVWRPRWFDRSADLRTPRRDGSGVAVCRLRPPFTSHLPPPSRDEPCPSVTDTPLPAAAGAVLRHPTRASRGLALSRAAWRRPPLGGRTSSGPRQGSRWRLP